MFFFYRSLVILLICLSLFQFCGCASKKRTNFNLAKDGPPAYEIDHTRIGDAIPKHDFCSKYSNPTSYKVLGKRYYPLKSSKNFQEKGIVSWYGAKFHDRRTSCGEPYDLAKMTAAHRTLPLPTYVQVTNLSNGKSIIVKVNDRGPFAENRIMDLSYVAAKKLDVVRSGTALVEIKAIDLKQPQIALRENNSYNYKNQPTIYLQVGTFAKEINAMKAAKTVKQLTHFPIIMINDQLQGKKVYRLRIGPIAKINNSDPLYYRLQQAKLGKPKVIIN